MQAQLPFSLPSSSRSLRKWFPRRTHFSLLSSRYWSPFPSLLPLSFPPPPTKPTINIKCCWINANYCFALSGECKSTRWLAVIGNNAARKETTRRIQRGARTRTRSLNPAHVGAPIIANQTVSRFNKNVSNFFVYRVTGTRFLLRKSVSECLIKCEFYILQKQFKRLNPIYLFEVLLHYHTRERTYPYPSLFIALYYARVSSSTGNGRYNATFLVIKTTLLHNTDGKTTLARTLKQDVQPRNGLPTNGWG